MLAFEALDADIQKGTIVWTAYPQQEITTPENAPEFNPEGPEAAPVLGWQYAIEAEACAIDTIYFLKRYWSICGEAVGDVVYGMQMTDGSGTLSARALSCVISADSGFLRNSSLLIKYGSRQGTEAPAPFPIQPTGWH